MFRGNSSVGGGARANDKGIWQKEVQWAEEDIPRIEAAERRADAMGGAYVA